MDIIPGLKKSDAADVEGQPVKKRAPRRAQGGGRPKKQAEPEAQPAEAKAEALSEVTEVKAEPPKKKRGRPRKKPPEEQALPETGELLKELPYPEGHKQSASPAASSEGEPEAPLREGGGQGPAEVAAVAPELPPEMEPLSEPEPPMSELPPEAEPLPEPEPSVPELSPEAEPLPEPEPSVPEPEPDAAAEEGAGELTLQYDFTSDERYVDSTSRKTEFDRVLEELETISKDMLGWDLEKFTRKFEGEAETETGILSPEESMARKFDAFLGGFITNAAMELYDRGYRKEAFERLDQVKHILEAKQKLESEVASIKAKQEEDAVDLTDILGLLD